MELPGFRKMEYLTGATEHRTTQNNSEHQSGSNPNKQGHGRLDFFFFFYLKIFHNKVFIHNTTLVVI